MRRGGVAALVLLAVACRPAPEPPVDAGARDAAGLSFVQLFGTNETFADGGALEGSGLLYLYLEVTEGALWGQVFAGGGDITIDGQEAPEYRAAPVEGLAWWQDEDHTCFDAWFYAPDRPAFEATITGCREQIWIDVEVGAGAPEEQFSMGLVYLNEPFFYVPD